MFIPFGEYLPDLPPLNNPGNAGVTSTTYPNCIPMADGYEPFASAAVFSTNTIDARPQGAGAFRDQDGTVFNFVGNDSKLYSFSGTTFTDKSKAGGYSTGSDERWEFTQYGRTVYATNFTDNIQAFTMGTSALFADLAGSPPNARYMSVVKDFLVLGNLDTGTSRVQWGPQGNPAGTWGTDQATGADYQDLDTTYGWVKQVVGGEYGIIFQERAIVRMTYVGAPLWFQFDEVEAERGTQAPGSVVKKGNIIYYIGTDLKFYAFNGSQSISIGVNKVDKTFQNDVDTDYLHRIFSVAHPTLPLIIWGYPSNGGPINRLMVYNYAVNRFTIISLSASVGDSSPDVSSVEAMYIAFVGGFTLDQLDSVNSNLDALPYSLDSNLWTGGQLKLAAFDDNGGGTYSLVYFDSDPYNATLGTKEIQPHPGRRTLLLEVRPHVEGYVSFPLNVKYRNSTADGASESSAGAFTPNAAGYCKMRLNSTLFKFNATLNGGFDHAKGIEITEAKPVGRR